MKHKGLYIVDESRFVESNWGPSTHILKGIKELEKYFDTQLFVLNVISLNNLQTEKKKNTIINKSIVRGTLSDLYKILISTRHTIKVLKQIKNQNIEFIYERAQYLSFSALLAARIYNIPHFYEKNWVEYMGIKQFYPSLLNFVAKYLEEVALRNSTHVFFIGNQNKFYSNLKENWSVVQNAADLNDFNKDKLLSKNDSESKIELCYVANLMDHHRFDVFLEALNILCSTYDFNKDVHLYLYGRNFDKWLDKVPSKIKVIYSGSIEKEKLVSTISKHHIGVISGGPSYSSFMKLYDYAAANLVVICPELENLQAVFSEECILYFKDTNSNSLAKKLKEIIADYQNHNKYAGNLHNYVLNNFTWEKIFQDKSKTILSHLK